MMIERLNSLNFSEYYEALRYLRKEVDQGTLESIEDAVVKQICAVYHFYTLQHQDIQALQKKILMLLEEYEELLDKYAIRGLKAYAEGYLKNSYNGKGFLFVSGTLEMAAMVEAQNTEKKLQKEYPGVAEVFVNYADLMKKIESSYHTVYWILKKIANQYTQVLQPILFEIEPVFKRFILHAMDEFVGDKNIISLYEDFIDFLIKTKNGAAEEVVWKECEDLIKETQGYLNKVKNTI